MTERNPYLVNKAFRSYLVSTILSTMAVSLGSMLGGIVVGNVLGTTELGAVNVMMPIIQLLAALNALINIGGATVMAIHVGRGDEGSARGIFTKSMILSLVVSVAIAVLGVAFIDPIMSVLCSDEALRPVAQDYGILVFAMSPLYILMPGIGTFVRTDNAPRLATVAFLGSNVVMLALGFVLMEYTGMGLTGFAVSTAVGYVAGIAILAVHFVRPGRAIGIGHGPVTAAEMLYMGSPTALAMGLIMVNMLGINMLVLDAMGEDGMAVRSVCLNIQMISSIFVSGISQTLQPVGGALFGARDIGGMRTVVRTASVFLMAVAVVITVLAIAVPGMFLTLYGVNDAGLHDEAVADIRLFAPYLLFQAANYMVMVMYQVFGNKPLSLSISIMECFFILALAYALCPVDDSLVWASFGIGEALVSVAILAVSLVMRRRDPGLSGIALLRVPEGEYAGFSVRADASDLDDVLGDVSGFLHDAGVDGETAGRAESCCGEVLRRMSEGLGPDTRGYMDLVLMASDGGLTVTARSAGGQNDPLGYAGNGMPEMVADGRCGSAKYTRAINQNNVIMTFGTTA